MKENNLTLTLLLPATHPEVQKGGLLTQHEFDAGTVTIVVYSMLTHHERGSMTLNGRVPEIRIVSKNDPSMIFDRAKQTVEEFSGIFATQLQQAEIHQMKVSAWIAAEIQILIAKARA